MHMAVKMVQCGNLREEFMHCGAWVHVHWMAVPFKSREMSYNKSRQCTEEVVGFGFSQ